jgi:hypothetical protein
MTSDDHEPFLVRIGLSRGDAGRLVEAIRGSSAQVAQLLKTPLVMTLLATLYQAEKFIPEDVPEFYERLFHTLFTTHDATKPGLVRRPKSHLGERRLQQLFEAFCFAVLQQNLSVALSLNDFNRCVDVATRASQIDCDPDAFRHDITRIAGLLQQEGDVLDFIHKSVLEFHAAAFIRSLSDTTAPALYDQLRRRRPHAWAQVLQFLSQIDEYRYVRYYGLPAIEAALRILTVEDGSLRDLKLSFAELYPDFRVVLEEEEGELFYREMGPFYVWSYLDEMDDIFSSAIADTIRRRKLSREMLGTRLRGSGSTELEAHWFDILDEKGFQRLERRVAQIVSHLRKSKRQYEDLLAKDRARIDLISLKVPDVD